MSDAKRLKLSRSRAALLVIDVQERLCTAMNPERLRQVRHNIGLLLRGARELEIPVHLTEQYPRGMGRTLDDIAALLPEGLPRHEKVAFSCGAVAPLMRELKGSGREQILVAGMETHVCVFQTVRDLTLAGYDAFVVSDAVISRTEDNHDIGLGLMDYAGAVLTSTEVVLFDLLEQAGTPEFKALAPLFK